VPRSVDRSAGLHFVYRSPYDGPLAKRVVSLPDATVLGWFQRAWHAAETSESALAKVYGELGGDVYSLYGLFDEIQEDGLPPPAAMADLAALVEKRTYSGESAFDEHSFRRFTDDDEVELAYYFFDRAAAADRRRTAWLFQEDWLLPDTASSKPTFANPFKLKYVLPSGGGEGTTYACLHTFYDGESLPGQRAVIPGVRLDGLAAYFCNTAPTRWPGISPTYIDDWPWELLLLRAMIDPGDTSIEPGLARCARYPLLRVGESAASILGPSSLGVGPHAAARGEFLAAAVKFEAPASSAESKIYTGTHVAIASQHVNAEDWQPWIFFDDLWANSQPELAESLLRYTGGWDPFA